MGIYLPSPCCSHGQRYVALSRARTASEVKVMHESASDDSNACAVKNVVSFGMLEKAGFR